MRTYAILLLNLFLVTGVMAQEHGDRPKQFSLIQSTKVGIPFSVSPYPYKDMNDKAVSIKETQLGYSLGVGWKDRKWYLASVKSCFSDGKYSESLSAMVESTNPEYYKQLNSYCCIQGTMLVRSEGDDEHMPKTAYINNPGDSRAFQVNDLNWVTEKEKSGPFYIFDKERTFMKSSSDIKLKGFSAMDKKQIKSISEIYCSPGLMSRKDFSIKNVQHQFGDYFKVKKGTDTDIGHVGVTDSDRSINSNKSSGSAPNSGTKHNRSTSKQ